jgi:hypothetical protein
MFVTLLVAGMLYETSDVFVRYFVESPSFRRLLQALVGSVSDGFLWQVFPLNHGLNH